MTICLQDFGIRDHQGCPRLWNRSNQRQVRDRGNTLTSWY